MDFSFGGADEVQEVDSLHFNSPDPSPTSPSPSSPSPSNPNSSPISGMPVVTSLDTVVVANAAVGILSGAGTGTAAVAAAAAAATAPPRLGLRRKSTGVGSPLVNVVATYDSIKSEQGKGGEGGKRMEENKEGKYDDADIGDTPMSPVLMRTKDSLLLKDMQKQKRRKNTINAGIMTTSILEKSDLGIPASNSAPADSGNGWNTVSEELRFLVDTEMKTRGLRSLHVGEVQSTSPPFCSPECIYTADCLTESPRVLRSPTQVPIPDTPTIGPCTMTVSGSEPADESISPLQLSSPILSSVACS